MNHLQAGISPLMLATNKGHVNVVKLLLKAKASVDLRDKASNPCTDYVYMYTSKWSILLQSAGWTALFVAATKGYLTIAELLMKHGADVSLTAMVSVYIIIACCFVNPLPNPRRILMPRPTMWPVSMVTKKCARRWRVMAIGL